MAHKLTLAGQAAFAAAALPGGDPVPFANLVLGDGNGSAITPSENDTELTNQVYSVGVQSIAPVDGKPNEMLVTAFVPDEAGPFTIREVGLENPDGDLLVISDYPTTVKVLAIEGITTSFHIEMVLVVSSADDVTIELTNPVSVPSVRVVNTQNGIKGGGDLSTDRLFELDINGLPVIGGDDVVGADDMFGLYDKSADLNKRISTDELAIALGIQEKIDEAIGGLPEDQVLGLATDEETITGTNTTKATHAKGTKAAIDAHFNDKRAYIYMIGQS